MDSDVPVWLQIILSCGLCAIIFIAGFIAGWECGQDSLKKKIKKILLQDGYGEYKFNAENETFKFVRAKDGKELF